MLAITFMVFKQKCPDGHTEMSPKMSLSTDSYKVVRFFHLIRIVHEEIPFYIFLVILVK